MVTVSWDTVITDGPGNPQAAAGTAVAVGTALTKPAKASPFNIKVIGQDNNREASFTRAKDNHVIDAAEEAGID